MLTKLFDIAELRQRRAQGSGPYLEFLSVAAMSAGLYVLPAGGTDRQIPHHEDELYYVIRGRARLRVASEEHAVGEGSIIFVAAKVEHRFYEIQEELVVLVFFAPAENETELPSS
jgi:mannose-6-phosphate isomerase-like protein (cupin superfamily)